MLIQYRDDDVDSSYIESDTIVKVMKRRMRRTEEKRDEGTKREFNPM